MSLMCSSSSGHEGQTSVRLGGLVAGHLFRLVML